MVVLGPGGSVDISWLSVLAAGGGGEDDIDTFEVAFPSHDMKYESHELFPHYQIAYKQDTNCFVVRPSAQRDDITLYHKC